MRVHEVMTKNIEIIPPESTIFDAARKMKELNVSVLPVGDKNHVNGLLTDHDIVIDVVAVDRDIQDCTVDEIMSKDVETVSSSVEIEEASQIMESRQVPRIIVVDQNNRPVGVVSKGDLARIRTEASIKSQ